jgi:diguanylate cyclase (GGDEF)-like protein
LRLIDPLTGLGTGKYFLHKLRQSFATAQRYKHPCAVLLVNLSNLAELQQAHGREVGDRAMVMAAARLRTATQSTDSVARVGDSYFAVLTEGPMTSAAVNQMATKILASGLRPSQELPHSASLRFHIAIGYMAQPAAMDENQTRACLMRVIQAVKEMDLGSPKAIRLFYL